MKWTAMQWEVFRSTIAAVAPTVLANSGTLEAAGEKLARIGASAAGELTDAQHGPPSTSAPLKSSSMQQPRNPKTGRFESNQRTFAEYAPNAGGRL